MIKQLFVSLLILGSATVFGAEKAPTPGHHSDEPITIWFVRHGKTILNTLDRVQGWADSPLTEEGRRMAAYLGQGLKGVPFDGFYSSDAGRQRETIKILRQQLGIKQSESRELQGLREVYYGSFEGDFNRNMAAAAARQLGLADTDEMFSRMKANKLSIGQVLEAIGRVDPAGTTESYQQVKQRTQAALHTIIANAQKQHQKNVLVVSSGMAIQIMISDLTDNPQKNSPLANLAVVKLIYQHDKIGVAEIGNMKYVEQGEKSLLCTK